MKHSTFFPGCLLPLFLLFVIYSGHTQSVGVNTTTPDASAALDVTSTTQGILVPRLTTAQRTAVSGPATGLLVFDNTTKSFWFYTGTAWTELVTGGSTADNLGNHTATANIKLNDNWLSNDGGNEGVRVSGTGDVGIGTSTPSTLLHVGNGILLNTGISGSGPTLSVSGAGSRMFFVPRTGSFRAGRATGTEWDAGNVGDYSVAFGTFNKASGFASFSAGEGNIASGNQSIAVGHGNTASGSYSTATGYANTTTGTNSFVAGQNNEVTGANAVALGTGLSAPSYSEVVLGTNNTVYTPVSSNTMNGADRIFTIGIGIGTNVHNDAMVVLKSGNVGIGTSSPVNDLDVEGGIAIGASYSGANTAPFNGAIIQGKVGIGTSSPTTALEVNGTTKTTNLQVTNGAVNGYLLQSDGSGNAGWVNSTTLANGNWTTSGTDQYAALSGNVGIGTTSPGNKLSVSGNADITGNVGIGVSVPGNKLSVSGNVNFSGNLGLGIASPSNKLEVVGTTKTTNLQITNGATDGYLLKSDASGNASWVNSTTLANSNWTTSGTNQYSALSGNVGIGTTSPSDKLTVSGSTYISGNLGIGTAPDEKLSVGGNSEFSGNVEISGKLEIAYPFNNNYDLAVGGSCHVGSLSIGGNSFDNFPLSVSSAFLYNGGGFGYLNDNGNTGNSSGTNWFSIYVTDRIGASEFNAFSDARIKKIRGLSDSRADLQTLLNIEITDYQLKDSISRGNTVHKKVIAQQVEKIYPQAVTMIKDVVPDIYRLSEIKNGRIELKDNTLQKGDKVRLIFGERMEMVSVTAADASGFSVDLSDEGSVFVYGRQVNDFRTVDYEALSMLNISATQELIKTIRRQSETIDSMKADIRQIKAALNMAATDNK